MVYVSKVYNLFLIEDMSVDESDITLMYLIWFSWSDWLCRNASAMKPTNSRARLSLVY